MQTVSAIALSLLAVACGSSSSLPHDSYSFGRIGGNIRPYAVTISPNGTVTTQGAVLGSPAKKLGAGQLRTLARLVETTRFFSQPKQTRCPGVLPDVAATFVQVAAPGRRRRVLVHGTCNPRFQRLYEALARAVGVQ